MVTPRYTLCILLLSLHSSVQKSTPESPTYRAAVVELKPAEYRSDPARTLNENTQKCVRFIEEAAIKDADIVVFPELCISTVIFKRRPYTDPWATLVPHPSENYAPCTNSSIPVSKFMHTIACAAKKQQIYVVINVVEKELCSGKDDCPSDGVFYFITNVVFDREGKIIARGRKIHLFDEFGILDVMKTLDVSTFDTDFGVKFGSIVCLDLIYEEPITQMKELNITDIVYTSGWYSMLPFQTTIQMESAWAYAQDVNLLAGGYNKISDAYSGSGIYAGRQGIVSATLRLEEHEELLVAEVLKKSNKPVANGIVKNSKRHHLQQLTNIDREEQVHEKMNSSYASQNFAWKYDDLTVYETRVISTNDSGVHTLRHMQIECEFRMNMTNLRPPLTYRLFALDGVRTCRYIAIGTRLCAIVQCANDTLESCGQIQDSPAIFNNISITASWVDNGRTLMMPTTLDTNMLSFENWEYTEHKHDGYRKTSISLTKPIQNLVTFGIGGRNYEADRLDYTPA